MNDRQILLLAAFAGIFAALILLICLAVRRRRRKKERQRYYHAAARMIKENTLDEIIRSRGARSPVTHRLMFYVCVEGPERQGFVFDPARGIRIGRDPQHNEICIRDSLVSASHCCLYLYQGNPVIQDYDSSNGTFLRRGLHRRRRVIGMSDLRSGDRIRIGDARLEVTFFEFDMMDL